MFISSAAALVSEFHFDGFRVDLTNALHELATIHANGSPANDARIFGAKFLREWTRTLKLIRPNVFLIAEDHSNWDAVTRPTDQDGLGFDAKWFADYYHNLIGDARDNSGESRLINTAGGGGDGPLAMGRFADRLRESAVGRVVYHESHDEAGGGNPPTARTIAVAVGVNRNTDYDATLINQFRSYAEGRVHFAAGVTLLGPGTPMFFMGEEVGAWRPTATTTSSTIVTTCPGCVRVWERTSSNFIEISSAYGSHTEDRNRTTSRSSGHTMSTAFSLFVAGTEARNCLPSAV